MDSLIIERKGKKITITPFITEDRDAVRIRVEYEDSQGQQWKAEIDRNQLREHNIYINKFKTIIRITNDEEWQTLMGIIGRTDRRRWEENQRKFREEGIDIVWGQDVSNYDWPTLPLNSWSVDYLETRRLDAAYGITIEDLKKLYQYAKANNLLTTSRRTFSGWSTVELTDYHLHLTPEILEKARHCRTPQEVERLKKEVNTLKDLLSNREKLLSSIFVSSVHVAEDGSFSDCDDYCDDCFWYNHIVSPYWKDIMDIADEKFYVRGKNGKTYTYYVPTENVLRALELKYSDLISKKEQDIRKKIEEYERIISLNSQPQETDKDKDLNQSKSIRNRSRR